MNAQPKDEEKIGTVEKGYEESVKMTEIIEFKDGAECLAADCPYRGYTAMVDRNNGMMRTNLATAASISGR